MAVTTYPLAIFPMPTYFVFSPILSILVTSYPQTCFLRFRGLILSLTTVIMFGTFVKKAIAYTGWVALAFDNRPPSPHPAAVRLLNVSGITNFSLARNGTLFNATEIYNFTVAKTFISDASTVTLPESFLPVFGTATAASELQYALSSVTIQVSTSSASDSHGVLENFGGTSRISSMSLTHPTPTGSAVIGATESTSFDSTALNLSSAPMVLSTTIPSKPTQPSAQPVAASSSHLSIVQLGPSSASHSNVLATVLNIFATTNRLSDIPSPSPSISSLASNPISVLNRTSNPSLALSGSAKDFPSSSKSLKGMSDCKGLICKEMSRPRPTVSILNSSSIRFSNFPHLNSTDIKEPADLAAWTGFEDNYIFDHAVKQFCEDIPVLRATPLCKKSRTGPIFEGGDDVPTFPKFNVSFDFVQYFEDLNAPQSTLNDHEVFPDDDPEIPDKEYFALNEENFRDSMVEQWYPSWTVIAQKIPDYKKLGEWGLFWKEYLGEPNFRCPSGFASCNYQPPTLEEIRRRFPSNRPLGRRVLFTTMMYGLMHDYVTQLDTRFKDTTMKFQTLLPDLVETFTLQKSSDKSDACDTYKLIAQTAIDVVIDLGVGALTDGIGAVITNKITQQLEKEFLGIINVGRAQKVTRVLQTEKQLANINWRGDFDAITKKLQRLKHESQIALEAAGKYPKEERSARRKFKDIGVLHDTFAKDELKSSEEKLKKLQKATEDLQRFGIPRMGKKLGEAKSDEMPTTFQDIKDLKVRFGDQKSYIDDWAQPIFNNVVQQVAWNPMNHMPQQWLAQFYHHGYQWGVDGSRDEVDPQPHQHKPHIDEEHPFDVNLDWDHPFLNEAYKAWPKNKLKHPHEELEHKHNGAFIDDLPQIIGGSGTGWMCSDFEGDWKDHNEDNTKLLQKRVTAELEAARRNVWELYKDLFEGAVPEPGKPSMMSRWMLARRWIGKETYGTIEHNMNNLEEFHRLFEIEFVKDLASSTLAAGYNYMKCSHRADAVEKCAKEGWEYGGIFCPETDTDPTLVCQPARWYFSSSEPHEIDMVAIKSIENFGHTHGYQFNLKEMLQEIWENYKKFGNRWGSQNWGLRSMESAYHPIGFHLPVCLYEENEYDVHNFHQRAWWKNLNFPATCGNHAANETADFMDAMSLGPGSAKHIASDWTYQDRIPRVLWNKSPYTVYMSFCEIGIRWPNKNHDDVRWWDKYRVKTSKDTLDTDRQCGEPGYPLCPDSSNPPGYQFSDHDYGDQDCKLVTYSTLHMDEKEANTAFCTNVMGHTVFDRQAPHVWVELLPLTAWKNNEHHCNIWLEEHGVKVMEEISHRTLEAAEKQEVLHIPPALSFGKSDVVFYISNSTEWGQAPSGNKIIEDEERARKTLDGLMKGMSSSPQT